MTYNILILGASYGSLLSTKLLMAGHNATLVCRRPTVDLINSRGTKVRITRRGESAPDEIASQDLPGTLNAATPDDVRPEDYDLVGLAMQEPQFRAPPVWKLLDRIAAAGKPCLSIMNIPPLAYLRRIPGLDVSMLRDSYTEPRVWDGFEPGTMSLCSPDPQAFRPPDAEPNVLHVGLATNFKAVCFEDFAHTAVLKRLEGDILAARCQGNEIPVKLRVHESLFVPMAKWSMLMTGNYRSITAEGPRSIKDAVHHDLENSKEIYGWVDAVAKKLGAKPEDQVPFEKYANAAKQLLKPSSAARAVFAGAPHIERVDKLVQKIGRSFGMANDSVDRNIRIVDAHLEKNRAA